MFRAELLGGQRWMCCCPGSSVCDRLVSRRGRKNSSRGRKENGRQEEARRGGRCPVFRSRTLKTKPGLEWCFRGKGRANRRRRKADWCQRRLRERGNKSRGGKREKAEGMDRGCFECGSKRSSFQLVRVSGAPSGSLSSFWRVPRQSSVGARYTRVKGTRRGLARCVEEGGILLVSGTPRPSSRVPLSHLLSCHWVTSLCLLAVSLSVPTEQPRVHVLLLCWLCSEASFFFFLLMARQIHSSTPKVCVQICSNWGFDYPGPGISVGDRPGRMAKCMWGPFRVSIPGLAGLVWSGLCFFSSSALGRGNQGTRGIPRDCKSAAQTAKWKVLPGAITVWAHRLQQTGPDADGRRTTDGWMIKLTDLANAKPQKPKPTNHYVHIANGRVCC